jgi:hypothetical protein
MSNRTEIIPAQDIAPLIRSIRDQRVMLDRKYLPFAFTEHGALINLTARSSRPILVGLAEKRPREVILMVR